MKKKFFYVFYFENLETKFQQDNIENSVIIVKSNDLLKKIKSRGKVYSLEETPFSKIWKEIRREKEYYKNCIIVTSSFIQFSKNFEKKVLENINGRSDVFFYSNYIVKSGSKRHKIKLFDFNGDITERFKFGNVLVYTFEVLDKVFSENRIRYLKPALYSVHLYMIAKKYKFIHSTDFLYYVLISQKSNKKLDVFNYLFYDKKEEKEIEKVFENFLKENGYYIGSKFQPAEAKDEPTDVPISVVIPVFNREKFIEKSINSVLNQNFKNFEIIAVDNMSTDSSYDILQKLAKRDKRIKVYRLKKHNSKAGISKCLNLGIKKAKGKYIAQLDSDDEYSPNTLREAVKTLDKNKHCGLAVSYYELIDVNSKTIDRLGIIKHEEYSRNNILRTDGAGAVRVWRKSVLKEFGYFDEKRLGMYGEDYDMVLKVSEKYDVCRIKKVLYRYRRHDDNTDVIRGDWLKINNKTFSRLQALKRRKKLFLETN